MLDEAPSFTAAVTRLRSAPPLAPVLFTVSGPRPGQGVVIERTATTASLRRIKADAPVGVTNHYVSYALEGEDEDDPMRSRARLGTLHRHLDADAARNVADALRLRSRPPLASSFTQRQVVMRAADGLLVAKVPGRGTVSITVS